MGRALVFARILIVIAVVGIAASLRPSSVEAQPATCGPYGGYNFNTLELAFPEGLRPTAEERRDYMPLIHLAAEGKLVPGEFASFRYQGVAPGNRQQRQGGGVSLDPSYRIPPSIMFSLIYQESRWANASSYVPWGAVGHALRADDCGFGLGQITTPMANNTDTASPLQALVGIHPAFNLAMSARMLADKWNWAPSARPIAGDGNPEYLEDWYYAIWSYNGFAWINHPMHPNRPPLRQGDAEGPIYHCGDPAADSYVPNASGTGPVYDGYADYTFSEIIYGCMRNPPKVGGERLWDPVEFHMPDPSRPEVASAFDPEKFFGCASSGCPGMDFPTSFPEDGIEPNKDIVPAANPSKAANYLGQPHLAFSGPSSPVTLEARPGGSVDSVDVTATNTGTFIAPFRIRTTERWLVVTDKDGSPSRYLHGSLAVGEEVEIILRNFEHLGQWIRETQQGHVAEMKVTLVPERMPAGQSTATVYFEPLFGGGSTYSLTVTGKNNTSAAPTPTPSPTPKPNPPSHRITIGGIVAQESR